MTAKFRACFLLLALAGAPASAQMRVVAQATIERAPYLTAVDPVARKGFFAGNGRLFAVDLDSFGVRSHPGPESAHSMAVDAAAGKVFVASYHGLTVGGRINVFDARSGDLLSTIAMDGYPWNIAPDFGRREMYVGNDTGHEVVVFDSRTYERKAAILLEYDVAELAIDRVRGRILAGRSNPGDAAVAIIDTATRSVVARPFVQDEGFLWDHGPYRPVADERAGSFYLAHASGELTIVDTRAGTARRGFGNWGHNVWEGAHSAAWGRFYRASYSHIVRDRSPILESVEAATGAVTVRMQPPGLAVDRQLVVDDDGGDLYLTDGAPTSILHRLDPVTLEIRESLPLHFAVSEMLRDPVTGRLFLAGLDRIAVVESTGAKPGTRVATSFRHTAFDHHFVTADPVEQRLVDDGRFGPEWRVAPDLFRVWSQPVAGSVPVCRFFSARFAPKSSHFYTPLASECDSLKAGGDWQYEGIVFHVALPDSAGACASGTEPLYRLFNQGRNGAPNHWFTASRASRDEAVGTGWVAEGTGPDTVFACTPALR